MRRLNVLTWHTHGSYLYYLSHAPHEFHVLARPGRPPGYGGRCGPFPFGSEPFGITPVEAMACARPVIGAEVGGIKSTVVEGGTGFLVPSRDPQAVAERLATLHRNPDLARSMGEAGLRRAYRHYTWRIVAQQIAAIYAAVLAETGERIKLT